MILDLDGPSAVGKTTLMGRLCETIPGAAAVPELLAGTPNPYIHWKTPADFLEKQLWFFHHTLQRYAVSPGGISPGIQFNDIGILDVILHTAAYPRAGGLGWDVFPQFRAAVLDRYGDAAVANGVIYLFAEPAVLEQRKEGDNTRVRGAFASNLLLYPFQRPFYEELAQALPRQVLCLNARTTPARLAEAAAAFIKENADVPPLRLDRLLEKADLYFSRFPLSADSGTAAENRIQ